MNEIHELCMRVKTLLGSDIEDQKTGMDLDHVSGEDQDARIDLDHVLGKPVSFLLEVSNNIPAELREVLSVDIMSLPTSLGKRNRDNMSFLQTGSLALAELSEGSEAILVQTLEDCWVNDRKMVDGGVDVATRPFRFTRVNRFTIVTGIVTTPVITADTYHTSSTIILKFYREILDGWNLSDGRLKRYFSNMKTGSMPFRIGKEEWHAFQIIINCLIVLHHWVRYDMRKEDDITTSDTVVLTKSLSVQYSQRKLGFYVNLFSLENCINDWIYLWVTRLRRFPSLIHDFKSEMQGLYEIQQNPLVDKIIEYATTNNFQFIEKKQARELVQNALQTAIRNTFHGLLPDQLINSFVAQPVVSRALTHLTQNRVVIAAAHEMFENDTWQSNIEMFLVHSHPITHLSMLQPGDYILVHANMLARVDRLTLVDPFLSNFVNLQSNLHFRKRINNARAMETDNLSYITEKMSTLVFIDPDGASGSLGQRTGPLEDLPPLERCGQFFNVMSLQLTYTLKQRQFTTLDFTEIRLVGESSRKLGHSKPSNLAQFTDQSPTRTFPICDICGRGGAGLGWLCATSCGHMWHETCHQGYRGNTCAVCLRHTWIQRKGAAL